MKRAKEILMLSQFTRIFLSTASDCPGFSEMQSDFLEECHRIIINDVISCSKVLSVMNKSENPDVIPSQAA